MKHIILFSAFLTGFAAIALEVLWTRVMVMVVGGSVYAFTIVLISFLLGIVLGSTSFSICIRILTNEKRMRTNPSTMLRTSISSNSFQIGSNSLLLVGFAILQLLLGASVIFTIPALGELPFGFLELFQKDAPSFWSLQFLEVLMTLRIMILPTLLMGISLPLLISISMSVGKIYAANTFGGVLGALAASFFVIPVVGVQRGILLSGAIYLIIGLSVLSFVTLISADQKADKRGFRLNRLLVPLGFFVVLVATFIGLRMAPWRSEILSSGFYKDPTLYAGKDKEILIKQLKQSKVLFEKEGISAHVAVTRSKDGVLNLKINGKADASTGSDMENQLLLGHLPMLLHKDPKEVLVVGLGSGITLGSVLSHPVEHVDAIEIEEKVVEAAKFFNKFSNNALDDPRVRLIVADGRNYLLARTYLKTSSFRHSGKPVSRRVHPGSLTAVGDAGQASMTGLYDVITSEPSNPWLSGSSKLFTKEYFELYKKSIKDDGVVIHWINLHSIDQESLKRVFKAYYQVFPHVAVFGVPASNDLLLIGANKPIAFDYSVLVERFTGGVRGDLAKVGINEPYEILAYFVLDQKALKKIVGNTPPNTDNYPYVEFSAPKYLYAPVSTNPWRVIIENLSPIESVIARDQAKPETNKEWLRKADKFRRSRLLTQIYSIEKNIGEGIKEGEKALKIDPDNIFIKETLAQFYFEEGTSFFNQSYYGKAISSLSKSIGLKKTPEAYFSLGQSYGWDGNLEKAKENYEKAVSQDVEFEIGWQLLGDTLTELGDLNGAIEAYKKVVDISPNDKRTLTSLGQLYILRRDFGKAEEFLNKALSQDLIAVSLMM